MILHLRQHWFKVLRIILTILSIGFITYYVWKNFHVIQINDPKWLVFCLAIPMLVIPLIGTNRWRFFLALNGIKESIFHLAKINFISIFYGLILPSSSGFDAIRILMIENKHPEKRGQAGSTVILERLMGLLSLSLIGIVAALLLPEHMAGANIRKTILIVSFIIFLCIASFLTPTFYKIMNKLLYSRLSGRKNFFQKLIDYVEKAHNALYRVVGPSMLIKSFLLILLFQLTTILNVAFVYKALGVHLSLTVHMMIMPIIYILSIVPITMSGFGVREGLFAYFYNSVGVDSAVAVMASLINYVLLSLLPAIIGFIFVLLSSDSQPKLSTNKPQSY